MDVISNHVLFVFLTKSLQKEENTQGDVWRHGSVVLVPWTSDLEVGGPSLVSAIVLFP